MCQKSSLEENKTNKSDALLVYYIRLSSKTVFVIMCFAPGRSKKYDV